jgi:hypothetical protein
MSTINVSEFKALVIEMAINESLEEINKNKDFKNIKQENMLLYLCTLVLEKTQSSLEDKKITQDERIEIITNVISVLIARLPFSEALKSVFLCFINDGEIQKILCELEDKTSKKCMRCLGPLFRACMKSRK